MPCTCDGYPEPKPDVHNGPLADALCKVMQEHEARGEMGCFDEPTLKWWEEHKRRDRARAKKDLETFKQTVDTVAALRKLNAYERKLLGV